MQLLYDQSLINGDTMNNIKKWN